MSKNKTTKKSVYILTEGGTEEAYFSRIGEIVGVDTEWKYSVTVEVREIISGSKTDPINIFKEAKKSKKDYDEIWVVFDKDRERDEQNQKAIELAIKSKINVAFSSISFEHWLILHFERNTFAFQRSDCESRSTNINPVVCVCNETICASSRLKSPTLYPTFKKGYSLLYDDFQSKNNIAIENAAWLRHQKSPYTSIHLLNPYSDTDILLCELLNLKRVEYSSIGNTFIFEGITIGILNSTRNGNNISVELSLINQRETAFLINNNQPITLTDGQDNSFSYNSIPTSILNPTFNQNIVLIFAINPTSTFLRLKVTTTNKTILVDL